MSKEFILGIDGDVMVEDGETVRLQMPDGSQKDFKKVKFYKCNRKKECNKSPKCGFGCIETSDPKFADGTNNFKVFFQEIIKN